MKNRVFLFAILLSFSNLSLLKAQNLSFGILTGPSTRSFSYGSGSVYKNPDIGNDIGLLTELQFSAHFSLQPMVEFSEQGSKNGAFVSNIDYDPTLYPNSIKFAELNYLMVPVLAKASWRLGDQSHMHFFINAGPYAAFLLLANQVLVTPNGQKISGTGMTDKAALNTFNAGIDGNVGLSYYFNLSSVFIQAGGNYGFLKLQKDQSAGANYAGGASLAIGYTIWFDNSYLKNDHIIPRN